LRIESIELKATRRFSQLSIVDLPDTAKLIFLCGPNGSGKSSLFDGIRGFFLRRTGQVEQAGDYMMKRMTDAAAAELFPTISVPGPPGPPMQMPSPRNSIANVTFHSESDAMQSPIPGAPSHPPRKLPLTPESFYFRSAHRNEAEFTSSSIGMGQRSPGAAPESFGPRTIDNDAAVSRNYQRLVSESVQTLWGTDRAETTFGDYRAEMIGQVSTALERLFPGLQFTGVGAPLKGGTFRFDKGVSKEFPYRDLSGGEKAAFDILLDIFTRQATLTDSVMCIDEPEAHLNARVHGDLLSILFEQIADRSQLWIASHSIGMMRRARDLARSHPGEVVFLDFEGHDFDAPVTLKPVVPDRDLWKRALRVALDDIEELVAPEHIVICEGEASRRSLDAACYDAIFAQTHPETQFVAGGAGSEVAGDGRGYAYLVGLIAPGTKVTRVVDRDDQSQAEIVAALPVRTLPKRNIESYLFSDRVLQSFSERLKLGSWATIEPQVQQALTDAVGRGNPADDRKPAASNIYNILRIELGLTGIGSSATALAREHLVGEIVPGTPEYDELEATIFGPETPT
jgi:predicted ATPase